MRSDVMGSSALSLAKNLIIKDMDRRNKAGVVLHESSVHSDEIKPKPREDLTQIVP